MKKDTFLRSVLRIALPVALQAMLQSSFSMIDQIMVGQLGSWPPLRALWSPSIWGKRITKRGTEAFP